MLRLIFQSAPIADSSTEHFLLGVEVGLTTQGNYLHAISFVLSRNAST